MTKPVAAQPGPYAVDVKAGESYWWCSCGLSQKQPFCDGAHKGTGLSPIKHSAVEYGTMWFCGCKATAGQPSCDGSHNSL